MSYATEQGVPRYIFHIQAHSELIGRLVELQRGYRLRASHAADAVRTSPPGTGALDRAPGPGGPAAQQDKN
jgi:hypothetical protein